MGRLFLSISSFLSLLSWCFAFLSFLSSINLSPCCVFSLCPLLLLSLSPASTMWSVAIHISAIYFFSGSFSHVSLSSFNTDCSYLFDFIVAVHSVSPFLLSFTSNPVRYLPFSCVTSIYLFRIHTCILSLKPPPPRKGTTLSSKAINYKIWTITVGHARSGSSSLNVILTVFYYNS